MQRGGCSFQTKLKNAEYFGAEMVLISDFASDDEDEKAKQMVLENQNSGVF